MAQAVLWGQIGMDVLIWCFVVLMAVAIFCSGKWLYDKWRDTPKTRRKPRTRSARRRKSKLGQHEQCSHDAWPLSRNPKEFSTHFTESLASGEQPGEEVLATLVRNGSRRYRMELMLRRIRLDRLVRRIRGRRVVHRSRTNQS